MNQAALPPARHFSAAEFAARRARVLRAIAAAGLDGAIFFRQETLYWLTGFDSFGYVFFQCLLVRADGEETLLARSADLRQAARTSDIRNVRIWKDGADAAPEIDLAGLLREQNLAGKRIGIEWDAYGLTAALGFRLQAALAGVVETADISRMVDRLRMVKSEAELRHVRRAAALADDAFDAARECAADGVDEGEILAAMHGAIYRGGGDNPGNPFIIGSGADALLCRYKSGRRVLRAPDLLTLEWAGVFRHYHAALMRTFVVEPPSQKIRDLKIRDLREAAAAALFACEERLRAGATAGDVFAAHARALDSRGLAAHRLNACGYSMGATFAPSWMDYPMFYENNPEVLAPGMVFFIHIIIMDSESGIAQTLGRTSEVTAGASRPLSRLDLDLVVV